jgi:hypothetical protein
MNVKLKIIRKKKTMPLIEVLPKGVGENYQNHKLRKPMSRQGFEPSTSRILVQSITATPTRSIQSLRNVNQRKCGQSSMLQDLLILLWPL